MTYREKVYHYLQNVESGNKEESDPYEFTEIDNKCRPGVSTDKIHILDHRIFPAKTFLTPDRNNRYDTSGFGAIESSNEACKEEVEKDQGTKDLGILTRDEESSYDNSLDEDFIPPSNPTESSSSYSGGEKTFLITEWNLRP